MPLILLMTVMTTCSAATVGQTLVRSTLQWLDQWVIRRQLCPFAAAARSHTRCVVCHGREGAAARFLEDEVSRLRAMDPSEPATTLIVLPKFLEFSDLMFLQEREASKLEAQASGDADPDIQLLAFHPRAQFGESFEDPADLALRSPYPVLHLLRDADVLAAEASWMSMHAPNTAPGIQERNAALLRGIGYEAAAAALVEAVINTQSNGLNGNATDSIAD